MPVPPLPSPPAVVAAPVAPPQTRITASMKMRPGSVLVSDAHEDGSGAALVIEGDGITVDFNGLILRGSPEKTEPDARKGTGILVRGKNITLKNVRVHGYKIGLMAKDAPGLRLIGGDFSYNWKQRLHSTQEREDLSDWMSYHHNEKNEWLRYGAGIYLDHCDSFRVEKCRITGGQCGLMIARSNRGLAFNNDFSFLSGIGVGLYRSSENRVMHNKIDWCVRGYSHGVYNRGQDSAGILVFEQCNKNVFAYNSVTHGGDGFFLWAGQTTMDTGQGGCNDNLLYANDFSHAPTNGIEATFSRNIFANNLVLECWHGLWGGYSYDTQIVGNVFGLNAYSVAIEHGQDNVLRSNTFFRDNTSVWLWQNDSAPDPNWGYPKHRDTRSHGYQFSENQFRDIAVAAVDLKDTADVTIADSNQFSRTAQVVVTKGKVPGLQLAPAVQATQPAPPQLPATMQPSGNVLLNLDPQRTDYLARFAHTGWLPYSRSPRSTRYYVAPLPGGQDPFLKPGTLRGRRYILVDEWGPYDFRRPLLWPRPSALPTPESATRRFEVLGPEGRWKVKSLSPGVTLSATSGIVPGEVTATWAGNTPGQLRNIKIELEYTGAATTDYRGVVTSAGKPVFFGYSEFRLPIDWQVRWFRWDKDTSDPRTQPAAFAEILKGAPIKEERTDQLNYAWPGALGPGLPSDYFATVAEGTFSAPPGKYTLEVTTDDGCRVWLDDKPLIEDAWKYQGPTVYTREVTLTGDTTLSHKLRVEHFEIDGYSTLQVRLRPAKP